MTLRAAVIGLNHYHVTGWIESLANFPDQIEIVSRYDTDQARATSDSGEFIDPGLVQAFPPWMAKVPFFTSLDDLIRDSRPEIALVTLPNRDAPAVITRLSRAGVHLLVDKPGAIDAPSAEQAFGAARSAGIKTAVAFTRRYGRAWQETAALIESGKLGSMLSAEAIFVTSSVAARNPKNLIFNRDLMGGGILHWLGVHDIDLLNWFTDEPIVEVQAMSGTHPLNSIDVEDTISVSFRFASGAMGTMHFAYALPRTGGDGYLALRGTKTSMKIEPNGAASWIGAGTISDPMLTQSSQIETASFPGYGAVGAVIIDDLLSAIANDREPLASGENAIAALRIIDAIYASARSGRRVSLPVQVESPV